MMSFTLQMTENKCSFDSCTIHSLQMQVSFTFHILFILSSRSRHQQPFDICCKGHTCMCTKCHTSAMWVAKNAASKSTLSLTLFLFIFSIFLLAFVFWSWKVVLSCITAFGFGLTTFYELLHGYDSCACQHDIVSQMSLHCGMKLNRCGFAACRLSFFCCTVFHI